MFDTYLDNILNEDLRDVYPQNEEPKVNGERNKEANKDVDIPTVNIMKRII